jgi:hypothetical protein
MKLHEHRATVHDKDKASIPWMRLPAAPTPERTDSVIWPIKPWMLAEIGKATNSQSVERTAKNVTAWNSTNQDRDGTSWWVASRRSHDSSRRTACVSNSWKREIDRINGGTNGTMPAPCRDLSGETKMNSVTDARYAPNARDPKGEIPEPKLEQRRGQFEQQMKILGREDAVLDNEMRTLNKEESLVDHSELQRQDRSDQNNDRPSGEKMKLFNEEMGTLNKEMNILNQELKLTEHLGRSSEEKMKILNKELGVLNKEMKHSQRRTEIGRPFEARTPEPQQPIVCRENENSQWRN